MSSDPALSSNGSAAGTSGGVRGSEMQVRQPSETHAADGPEEAWEEVWEPVDGPRWRGIVRTVPAWLISLLFHLGLLIGLGLCTFVTQQDLKGVFVSAAEAESLSEELDEFVEVTLEPLQEIDQLAQADLTAEIPDLGVIALGDLGLQAEIEAGSEISDLELPATTVDEIGALFGSDGDGMADISGGLQAAAAFFGARSRGDEFVFVVDNSNSMTRGRFETALIELMRTVNAMSPSQRFYVIFFSDTAYRMFHPEPATGLIPATDSNKRRLQSWLGTVQLCLRTDGEEAMQAALALSPDVIYILGDGAFTDKTTQKLTAPHNRRIPIHTLGMEVDPAGARQLQAIAEANGGTYRLVGASPAARMLAAQNPLPRNNVRGSVWGLKLPLVARPKQKRR
jgi:hypothetical protein